MESLRMNAFSAGFSATVKPWAERNVWKVGGGRLTESKARKYIENIGGRGYLLGSEYVCR